MAEPIKLHVGGTEPRPGWKILNILPGPGVDFLGTCTDLGQFADGSVSDIYASHVLEHLGFRQELPAALKEFHRVLTDDGLLRISVPDLDMLCRLIMHPQLSMERRFFMMTHLFGGQIDRYDFHKVGLNFDFLSDFLRKSGFLAVTRVIDFGLFRDCSTLRRYGHPISVNVEARKTAPLE